MADEYPTNDDLAGVLEALCDFAQDLEHVVDPWPSESLAPLRELAAALRRGHVLRIFRPRAGRDWVAMTDPERARRAGVNLDFTVANSLPTSAFIRLATEHDEPATRQSEFPHSTAFTCPQCGEEQLRDWPLPDENYCNFCGADMGPRRMHD